MALSILLATDGSPSALRAAHWIGNHYNPHQVVVTLLHVIPDDLNDEEATEAFVEARRLRSEKVLEETEAALGCCPSVETVSVTGLPHEEIVLFARQHHVDVIVMGRRGESALGTSYGSVSFAVFQHSSIPVTIVEPDL